MAGAALIIDGYNLIFRLAPEALAIECSSPCKGGVYQQR